MTSQPRTAERHFCFLEQVNDLYPPVLFSLLTVLISRVFLLVEWPPVMTVTGVSSAGSPRNAVLKHAGGPLLHEYVFYFPSSLWGPSPSFFIPAHSLLFIYQTNKNAQLDKIMIFLHQLRMDEQCQCFSKYSGWLTLLNVCLWSQPWFLM